MDFDGNYAPGSDEWWLQQLNRRLRDRRKPRSWDRGVLEMKRDARPGLDLLWDYYRGEPPLPKAAEGWHDAMYPFLRMSRMNYAGVAIRSAAERLWPIGWTTAVDNDPDGDQLAAEVAGVNEFDTTIGDHIESMLWSGSGYMLVSVPRDGSRIPVVTTEDPRSCIVARDAAGRSRLAGLKIRRDEWTDDGFTYHLHLPGRVRVARVDGSGWVWDESMSGPTGLSRVALVDSVNKGGVGEYERHLDDLDRINDGIFMRVTIAKFQAFRQRAAKLPDKDDDGTPMDYTGVFTADPGALWQVPLEADFWESTPIDLNPLRMAIRDDVEALALAIGIPLHWISPDAASGSAAGATLQNDGVVFRAEDRQRRVNSGLAESFSLAFEAMGEAERAQAWKIRTIWAPVERFSLADKAAALPQFKSAGVPWDTMMIDVLQKTPAELPSLKAQRSADALWDAMNAPAPAPALAPTVSPAPAAPVTDVVEGGQG